MLPAAVFRQTLKQAADAAVRKAEQTGTAADKLAAATACAAYAEVASHTSPISGQQRSSVQQQLAALLEAARSAQREAEFAPLIAQIMAATNDVNTNLVQLNAQLNVLNTRATLGVSHDRPGLPSVSGVSRNTSGNISDASSYAAKAAGHVADKSVVNSDPVAAARVAATVTGVVSKPAVAAVDPVRAAIVATQAMYVVNLPSVASNPAAASAVVAANTNVTAVGNLPAVQNAPANANFAADIASTKTIGQANQNVTVSQVTTPLIGDYTQGVKVDVIVVSAAG